jgi:hypothetical protein
MLMTPATPEMVNEMQGSFMFLLQDDKKRAFPC